MKNYLFIILLFISALGHSQLSKKHFIPPLTNAAFGNANPEDQYIYISTPSGLDITYTIIPVGQPTANHITGTVSNANPDEVSIGYGNGQLFIPSNSTSTITNDKGYIIEADAPVYVSVRMNAGGGAQAGALVSKGLSALGNIFRIGSYTNQNPQDNYLNFVSVMATEDNTQVTFDDLPAGLIIKNYTGITPITINLNEGESYTIATNSFDSTINRDGLIGSLVTSDKPIVVNCGSTNGSFSNGSGRDYGIDQIAGLSKIGTEYILVKGDGSNEWENILVVAHTNNTTISINGNPSAITINAGNYYLIEGNQFNASGNMYVETSEPVFVYQGVGATNSEANQGMFFVPPLSCEARGNLDNIANIGDIGNTSYTGGVSVVTKADATVTINGTPISNFSTIGPSPVTGKTDYVTYKVTGLSNNISVESSDELYCAYFNYNGAATSGSFYSGFPSAPEINFDAQFTTLGNCIPNVTLSAANTQSFDSFEWWFDDGSGFINLNNSNTSITPTIPGKYKLIGIITCTLERLESTEVPVSICPDDIDNDGIIDNLDIDNDNDGIQNCTESLGNVTVNLSNINTPQFIFQDNTTNTTLANSATFIQNNTSGNATNTFSGNTNGNYTSTVQPDTNAESDYSIQFSESINVLVAEDITTNHTITDGEFFIAKILPSNKNITVVDPDNRLLIDSNFDGAFETGVTQISGSEIHFKINPSPNGNTPYSFHANQVNGFSFTHRLANTVSSSTFTANISLSCYKLDSDGDGIKDEIDYDSDNDGIPDFIESFAPNNSPLSNIDEDQNGLDDAYDSNMLPIDNDNDGVPDYLDLDSDNDGIYDVLESNSGLPDTDFNGVIDNVNTSIGSNGWDNNAETNIDANTLGYTIGDLDTDGIYNYIDLESDGDNCSDVIEAGFSESTTTPGRLQGTGINTTTGVVTGNTDGYTTPSINYATDGTIVITTQPIDTQVCENGTTQLTLVHNPTSTIQWQVSTDNGTNWNNILNNAIYSGVDTNILTIISAPLSYNNYLYRAFLNRVDYICGTYSDEITLTVNPLPVVNANVILTQCDDDIDGFSPFNLTEVNTKISNNVANESFTYYTSQTAAIAGDTTSPDYINNPTAYINTTVITDVVWANIESSLGCSSISEIQLNVSATQIPATFQRMFNVCDDFLDVDGNNTINNNDRDGVSSFNFSSVTNDVVNLFPVLTRPNLSVFYYRNEADALAEINEITDITNYRNIGYPNSQEIYIRIDNSLSNDCLGLGSHITLTVEPLPIANTTTIMRQCDDDQDGLFPFDTSTIQASILNGQSLADVTITYFDANNAPLPSPLPNPFITATQTITIRVTNNVTADPNGPCYDETTLEFTVDTQPIANSIPPQIVCDGDAGDIDNDLIFPFDTSTFSTTILGAQTGMNIFYNYIDEQGNSVTNSTTLPNPLNTSSQIITVEVRNPNNTACIDNTTINLTVNPLPEFSINNSLIICTSDPTFTALLDPIENDPNEVFTYQWAWTSLDNTIQREVLPETTPTLTVSIPGTYHLTLTKTDGTSCPRTRDIFVNASEIATITLKDITIKDISENNTVTINDTNNNLGLGDYEYALEDEFSTLQNEAFYTYQDSPIFEDVFPGIYKLYVRDKYGCGTVDLKISVIGHQKFFTPNNDSINDYWQIKGINSQFQPNSVIYIFNRYGNLITQISPNSTGWDGTANGRPMPATDYWFKVNLEDGRVFKGHFALKR
ncbi:T9SS type B sorting domain-containing protein [uncultured Maribacter sp.]|uniref:T9SS type B sorting domain-containing protein n=1 Tax=uncultured Maribacter sp. TaxID=431308 RepID=UPI00262D6982|nr:T9SS type B sorting domain-containing protein [uncultured Maribacter sp.]